MMNIRLFDYQRKGVNDIAAKLIQGIKKLAYVLPTGGGKTVVFCYLAMKLAKTGKSIGIVVHRKKLVLQTSLALAALGVPHRIVAAGKITAMAKEQHIELYGRSFVSDKSTILVASVQTLARRLDEIKDIHLLIIDECHHANVGYWRQCIDHASKAVVLGVTATLIRLDGKSLGDVFDEHIEGPTMGDLIQRGRLCYPRVFAAKEQIDLSSVRVNRMRGDYDINDIAAIMDKPYLIGNSVQHYHQICPKVPAIAYCCNITHAEHVAEEFRQAGYNAICLTSKQTESEQFHILNKLAQGDIDVVSSVDIISEGTDVPLVGCAISLRPTDSLGLWDQQFGRPLRTYKDFIDSPIMQREHMKKLIRADGVHTAFILDHAGNSHKHGLPMYGRQWSLKPDIMKRNRESKPVSIVTCPKCNNIHEPQAFCPECNHEYVIEAQKIIESKSGELCEMTPDWAGGLNLKTEKLSILLKKAMRIEEIIAIQQARDYEYGWVVRQVHMRSDAARKYKHKARL